MRVRIDPAWSLIDPLMRLTDPSVGEIIRIIENMIQLDSHNSRRVLIDPVAVLINQLWSLIDHAVAEYYRIAYEGGVNLNWAKNKGPYVYEVIYRIFNSTNIEQRYYRTVHSILKLADTYSDQRLDNSCRLALDEISRPMYRDIKHILETGRDQCQENRDDSEDHPTLFTRGGDYFG